MAQFEETDLQEEEEEASYDEQHALVAQSIEVNKLRQQVDLLKRANERVKEQYRQEIRTLLQPLIGKHKALQEENNRLKRRLEEMSQVMPGEGLGDWEAISEEMAKLRYDNSVLQKVVDALENEVRQLRREAAEAEELRNVLKDQGSESVQYQRELESVRQALRKAEEQVAGLQEQEESLKAATAQLQAELADIDRRHQETLAGYQRQLGEAQHRIGNLQQQLAEWQSRAESAEKGLKEELSSTDELMGILAEARRLLEPDVEPETALPVEEPASEDIAPMPMQVPPLEEAPAWSLDDAEELLPIAESPEGEEPAELAETPQDLDELPLDDDLGTWGAASAEVEASDDLEDLVQLLTESQSQILDEEDDEAST